jgi:hypothetical protein
VRGTGAGVPRSAALGEANPAHRSSSTVSPRVSGLYLPSSPSAPPPPINWRWVEDGVESMCSHITAVEGLLHEMLASVHRNIPCPVRVSLERETKLCPQSRGLLHGFSFLLFLSRGSADAPVLLAEVTRVWDTTTTAKAARATAMLVGETSAQEAVAVQDSATLRVQDAEDQATLVKREALERVLRAKAENATALASAREDVEGLAQKITLFEDELVAEHHA